MARLDGKTALVTGAARGIGEAIARAFVREGATVIVTDIADEAARRVATELKARFEHLDVRLEADWERVLGALPRLDVLVNNAGITGFEGDPSPQDPENAALETWRAVHATNLDGVFLGCKHGIRAMRRSGGAGSIVNIGSRSGVVGIPGAAPYAASKGGVRNHTKTVALYCAEQGFTLRCNVIQPAAILTPMWDALLGHGPDRGARMAAFTKDAPLQRFGIVDEVAALAVYLASDESAYMTGAELTLDGGLLAGTAVPPRKMA
jgi:NAD(P)-dependent dehydrogenase (short-subunit alcohol dehydrogenase family)